MPRGESKCVIGGRVVVKPVGAEGRPVSEAGQETVRHGGQGQWSRHLTLGQLDHPAALRSSERFAFIPRSTIAESRVPTTRTALSNRSLSESE